MRFPGWLFMLPCAVESVRSRSAVESADEVEGTVVGKVIKCSVDNAIVFDEDEDKSAFSAGWERIDDEEAGVHGWGINIPGIVRFTVQSKELAAAKKGYWITPTNYKIFSGAIDTTGMAMRQSLPEPSACQGVSIIWGTVYTLRVIFRVEEGGDNVIIDFTKRRGRINLPAAEYFMPTQGKMISLKVDGQTVFDQASSTMIFPVVYTPAFLRVSNYSRGLDVEVVGFTWFFVRKTQMENLGYFNPNYHGYSRPEYLGETMKKMWEGLRRWWHRTVEEIDHDANLTIRTDANTVEISGNGTELVFSKEKVEGRLKKCTVGSNVVYKEAEGGHDYSASWEQGVEQDGADSWYITIPQIVRFQVNVKSLVASTNWEFQNGFVPLETMIYSDTIEPRGMAIREILSGGKITKVSTRWESHTKIKLVVEMKDKDNVEIEFTRGLLAADADHYEASNAQ